jgi:hypothetical protein
MDEQWNDWSRAARLSLSTRPGPFAAWRNELSATAGWFDERFQIAGDKEFWGRVASGGRRVGLIPKVLYLYTRNPQSISVEARQSDRWRREKALLAETNPGWPTEMRRRIRWIRCMRALMPSRYSVALPNA